MSMVGHGWTGAIGPPKSPAVRDLAMPFAPAHCAVVAAASEKQVVRIRLAIVAASLNRRVISYGVMRSRAHSMSRTTGTNPVPSGGSAISPKNRYISPRLVRS